MSMRNLCFIIGVLAPLAPLPSILSLFLTLTHTHAHTHTHTHTHTHKHTHTHTHTHTGAAQCPRTMRNPAPGGNVSAAAAAGSGLLPKQVLCYGNYLNSAQSMVPAIALPCAAAVSDDISCQAEQLSGATA